MTTDDIDIPDESLLLKKLHVEIHETLIAKNNAPHLNSYQEIQKIIVRDHPDLSNLLCRLDDFAQQSFEKKCTESELIAQAKIWNVQKRTEMGIATIGILLAGTSIMYYSAASWAALLGYEDIPSIKTSPGYWVFVAIVAMPLAGLAMLPFNIYRIKQQFLSPSSKGTNYQKVLNGFKKIFLRWPSQGLGMGYAGGIACQKIVSALGVRSEGLQNIVFFITAIWMTQTGGASREGVLKKLSHPYYKDMVRRGRVSWRLTALPEYRPEVLTSKQMIDELLVDFSQIERIIPLALDNASIDKLLTSYESFTTSDSTVERLVSISDLLKFKIPDFKRYMLMGVNVVAIMAAVVSSWNFIYFGKEFTHRVIGDRGQLGEYLGLSIGVVCTIRNTLTLYPLIVSSVFMRMMKKNPIDSTKTAIVNTISIIPGFFFGFTFLAITLTNESLRPFFKGVVAASNILMFSAISQDGLMGLYYEHEKAKQHRNVRQELQSEVSVWKKAISEILPEIPGQLSAVHCFFSAKKGAIRTTKQVPRLDPINDSARLSQNNDHISSLNTL